MQRDLIGSRISLALIEENRVVRECLVNALSDDELNEVAVDASSDCSRVLKACKPNVVLIGPACAMEKAMDFVSLIRREVPNAKIVILASGEMRRNVLRFVELGANGVVLNETSVADLKLLIKLLAFGGTTANANPFDVLGPVSSFSSPSTAKPAYLTSREVEIVGLVQAGRSNKEIAADLCLSLHTIKSHMHRVLEKLGVKRRWEIDRRVTDLIPRKQSASAGSVGRRSSA